MSLGKVSFIGNLGGDVTLRHTASGSPVCNFNVAMNRKWTNQDGSKGEETAWFRVSAWGKSAENHSRYLSKGRQVYVEGRLIVDPETGGPKVYQKNDGTFGASFEVNASLVRYLGGNGNGGNGGPVDPGAAPVVEPEEASKIPF